MPELPPNFRAWDQPKVLPPAEVIRRYEQGFAGCVPDPAAGEEMRSYGVDSVETACRNLGYEDTAKGEVVAPFLHVNEAYPAFEEGPAQRRGSCVVHCTRNAALLTMVLESVLGIPDEVTGHVEECPVVSTTAASQGVLACEPAYHYRGHRSDGWWCESAANVVVKYTGAVLRKDYGFVDLTKLDEEYAGKYWKRDQIPEEAKDAFDNNLFRDAAGASSFEAIRDILARGVGISSCGSEGFESKRDENGVCRRKGSWSHAMAVIAADDRPEIHRKYGGPLLLLRNSWGNAQTGPRRIMGTNLEIPLGCFWVRWADVRKRSYVAIAGLNGWKRKKLSDYLGGWA